MLIYAKAFSRGATHMMEQLIAVSL